MHPSSNIPSTNWFLIGVRHGFGMPALLLMATMCGIGGMVRDIGYPVWVGTLSTLLIWAGPAQVILFGAIAANAALPATAFAIALSSARFLPMTVSLMPMVRSSGAGLPAAFLAAHLVSMTTWVEGLRRLPMVPPEGRYGYFVGYGLVILGVGAITTHAGYYLYALVPPYLVAAFLFTTPLFFASAMIAGARGPADWLALAIGFFVTPMTLPYLPAGFDFLVIGMVGGTIAYGVHRRGKAKAATP